VSVGVAEAQVATVPPASVAPQSVSAPPAAAPPAPAAATMVVQDVPAPIILPDRGPIKVALPAKAAAPAARASTRTLAFTPRATGTWFVQVGAFRNPGVARDGWRHATRRMPALANHAPTGARFEGKGGGFYRLAFGGFTRTDAANLCRRYRGTGGSCFIRPQAGDAIASWAPRKPVQLAAR
jgi:hypothetical protein